LWSSNNNYNRWHPIYLGYCRYWNMKRIMMAKLCFQVAQRSTFQDCRKKNFLINYVFDLFLPKDYHLPGQKCKDNFISFLFCLLKKETKKARKNEVSSRSWNILFLLWLCGLIPQDIALLFLEFQTRPGWLTVFSVRPAGGSFNFNMKWIQNHKFYP